MEKISNNLVQKGFQEWFTMPLDGFPPEIKKLVKDTAEVAFSAGAAFMLGEVNKRI